MRAIGIQDYGDPDQLTELDLPTPEPGPGEVRIKVHAVATNPVDFKTRKGQALPLTPRPGEPEQPFPRVLGYDVSGTIDAVGPNVNQFGVGSEVIASPRIDRQGSNAEHVVVEASTISLKPAKLDHDRAAAMPLCVLTAWMVLYDRCDIQPKQTVLINGGAGGVGHIAIQLAKLAQCRVLATAGTDESMALCRSCGADEVINYREQDIAEAVEQVTRGQGCHAVFDTVGGPGLERVVPCVGPHGHLAIITAVADEVDLSPLFAGDASFHQVFMPGFAVFGTRPDHHGSILRQASGLVDEGLIQPHVAETRPLNAENLRAAHEQQEAGHVHGKQVLTMA